MDRHEVRHLGFALVNTQVGMNSEESTMRHLFTH
jgi:hypothetical protein